jgi:hypothetical protein
VSGFEQFGGIPLHGEERGIVIGLVCPSHDELYLALLVTGERR